MRGSARHANRRILCRQSDVVGTNATSRASLVFDSPVRGPHRRSFWVCRIHRREKQRRRPPRTIIISDRCVSCPVSQFIAKPMASKMKTAARPISITDRIRSERTINAYLSQPPPTMRPRGPSEYDANSNLHDRMVDLLANYSPASG